MKYAVLAFLFATQAFAENERWYIENAGRFELKTRGFCFPLQTKVDIFDDGSHFEWHIVRHSKVLKSENRELHPVGFEIFLARREDGKRTGEVGLGFWRHKTENLIDITRSPEIFWDDDLDGQLGELGISPSFTEALQSELLALMTQKGFWRAITFSKDAEIEWGNLQKFPTYEPEVEAWLKAELSLEGQFMLRRQFEGTTPEHRALVLKFFYEDKAEIERKNRWRRFFWPYYWLKRTMTSSAHSCANLLTRRSPSGR